MAFFRQGNRTLHATARLRIDEGQVRILLAGEQGEVSEEIRRRARAVQKRAQYRAPVRTGVLKHSISVNMRYPSEGAVADITAEAPYSAYVEFGRRAIEARPGSAFFLGEIGGVPIFTKRVGPAEQIPFMRNAIDEAARD